MESLSKQQRVQLSLDSFKKGQCKTKKADALAFDVPETTLQTHLQGTTPCQQKTSNCQTLSATEESTLIAWIIDMDKHGLPLQVSSVSHLAQLLLSACLSMPTETITIGGHWVNCFVKHHPELNLKYTQKYDYQCAKCEDPKLIRAWFT